MIRYILVPATGGEADRPVFATALAVARPFAAHLEFLHVRVDIQRVLVSMASADMGGGAAYDEIIASLEQDAVDRQQRAERAVHDFCAANAIAITDIPGAGANVTASWQCEIGEEPDWLATHGRTADMLVLGRAREGEPVALDILEGALMGSGRPVLLAPPKAPARIGGTVAIAWKDTREASRAVDAARPFIDAADHVVILAVEESEDDVDPSCERLCRALRWRNNNTTVHRLQPSKQPAAQVMLDAARAQDASLLVMGGYSHSRVREMVLGGFTRHILQGAALPVLMAH